MNILRCTVIDKQGAVSFITHGDALPALVAACASNPQTIEEFSRYFKNHAAKKKFITDDDIVGLFQRFQQSKVRIRTDE